VFKPSLQRPLVVTQHGETGEYRIFERCRGGGAHSDNAVILITSFIYPFDAAGTELFQGAANWESSASSVGKSIDSRFANRRRSTCDTKVTLKPVNNSELEVFVL
jgi:hypothetical protein